MTLPQQEDPMQRPQPPENQTNVWCPECVAYHQNNCRYLAALAAERGRVIEECAKIAESLVGSLAISRDRAQGRGATVKKAWALIYILTIVIASCERAYNLFQLRDAAGDFDFITGCLGGIFLLGIVIAILIWAFETLGKSDGQGEEKKS